MLASGLNGRSAFLAVSRQPARPSFSFRSQSTHRISLRGSTCRQVASKCGDSEYQERRGRESERVGRTNFIDQALQHTGEGERAEEAARHTGEGHKRALTEHEAHHVPTVRAKCHAQPEFVGAAADRVRNHAISPDSCKRDCKRCEQTHQEEREPVEKFASAI